MKPGKELPFNKHNCPSETGEQVRCSPLAFASFFNNDFFIKYYGADVFKNEGLITNQENIMLSSFSMNVNHNLPVNGEFELYTIFETDAKFSIPFFVLEEILADKPDSGKVYAYFTNTFTGENRLHKQIILWSRDACYLIDSSNANVIVMTHQEYITSSYLKRLTNLSVLMSIHDREFVGGSDGFDIELFKHLI